MKKHIFIILLFTNLQLNAQTYVSGGISSNTTWTLANSPYIVTGNVVVFQAITLIIEPGVVVKFDNGVSLEIQQSTLSAIGTAASPVIFTSNSPNPVKGSWDKIFVNQSANIYIDHCEFHYAGKGLTGHAISLTVANSYFSENITGMDAQSNYYDRVDSCTFRNNDLGQSIWGNQMSIRKCNYINNQTGLYAHAGISVIDCIIDSNSVCGLSKHMACNDTLRGNEIKYNGKGIAYDFSVCSNGTIYMMYNNIENNNVGIELGGNTYFEIHNNCICSNTSFDLKNLSACNVNASNNRWCSVSTAFIDSTIYDANDNISYGIVTYTPIDTNSCPIGYPATIPEPGLSSNSLIAYPNPASERLQIDVNLKGELTIELFDSNGRKVYSKTAFNKSFIDVSKFTQGIFTLAIRNKEQEIREKVVIIH